ncbi:MAG: hypothetical protein CM15mP23_21260 [Cryomorphaceae bacterium]|nr:MAG: hypothetical protein CM15mP23_21260 [Cryomorphaceae bacterium]
MVAFAAVLAVLILADMLPVNKRYLNADDFVKARNGAAFPKDGC